MTDGGRAQRVNLAVTAFSLLMSDVFFLYPPSRPPRLCAFFGTSKHQSHLGQSDLAPAIV